MTLPLRTLLAITETTDRPLARVARGLSSRPKRGQEPMPPETWWNPRRHVDRRPSLLARGRIQAALRRHFEAQAFTEVEASILQHSPGNEAHLHAFATEWIAPEGQREELYLHTSPEFACKKLLAAGERRICDFARVFRNREKSAL